MIVQVTKLNIHQCQRQPYSPYTEQYHWIHYFEFDFFDNWAKAGRVCSRSIYFLPFSNFCHSYGGTFYESIGKCNEPQGD